MAEGGKRHTGFLTEGLQALQYRCFLYCPNKAAAMGNILVSLSCAIYQWATLITFCKDAMRNVL